MKRSFIPLRANFYKMKLGQSTVFLFLGTRKEPLNFNIQSLQSYLGQKMSKGLVNHTNFALRGFNN